MLTRSKLLLNDGDLEALDEHIETLARQHAFLDGSRIKIREHLREGIRKSSVSVLGLDYAVVPRSRLQGSCACRTCIQRAHAHQEMDLDYGVYPPVSAFEDSRPRVAAKVYFELVESLLRRLCQAEGWTLDGTTDNCVRLKVSTCAHIDVSLYATPGHIFTTVQVPQHRRGDNHVRIDGRPPDAVMRDVGLDKAGPESQEFLLALAAKHVTDVIGTARVQQCLAHVPQQWFCSEN